jgi:DNA mismatch repair protein MutS2
MRDHLQSFAKLEFEKVKQHISRLCLSELGKEHAEQLTPLRDKTAILHRLALVSEMKLLLQSDNSLPLDYLFDVRISLQRSAIEDFILPSEELLHIALVIDTSLKIARYFASRKSHYPLLYSIVNRYQLDKLLQYNIGQIIDETGQVRDSASKELGRLRREIREKQITLQKTLETIFKTISNKDWIQEEIITSRDGRGVIPVKVEYKNQVPGFIHSSSSSGATVYIEPAATLDLNNDIRTAEFAEQREVARLLKTLTVQVRNSAENLTTVIDVLAELDFLLAKAKYSAELLAAAPEIVESGPTRLFNAYHPILLQKNKHARVVPLNIELGGPVNTIIITGPNAGGKSVTMKTVGLLTILAQAGCHIPASPESVISIYNDLFVDMGDEQSIEMDLSSFSSHLNNLKYIVGHADEQSLVLIDEIGSGTDPLEGSAIAASILEALSARGCSVIATTHHGSLKSFAFEHARIENGAMEFDQNTLSPTYRFKYGVPGSSYAIEMAERMNLDPTILARAKELKGTQQTNLEALILDLEKKSQELQERLSSITSEREELKGAVLIYETKIRALQKEVQQIKTQAVHEAQALVDNSKKTIERVIREIKETSASKESIVKAKDDIRILHQELTKAPVVPEEEEQPFEQPSPIAVGSAVRLKDSTTEGEVAEIDQLGSAIVLSGSLRIKVALSQLLPVKPGRVVNAPATLPLSSDEVFNPTIDLRGMYGDEALEAVAKAIDSGLLRGVHRIDIIHGKGTGSLRKKVTEFLKGNKYIKSFRLGEWNEGGIGVTVIELQ